MKTKIIAILLAFVAILGTIFGVKIFKEYKYKKEVEKLYDIAKGVLDKNSYSTNIDNINIKYVNNNTFQGFHLIPKNKLFKGVIVCYGGSEGSPNFNEALRLAKEGYETLSVFMFGAKNQQKTLVKIPLEQFEDVLDYIHSNINENTPITVLGASKGAEYALNLATKYKEIDNLVLIAPSSYNFSGLDFVNYGSSWTWKGKELPFIDLKRGDFSYSEPISYKATYETAVERDSSAKEKLIPVKKTKANILLISGKDDQMWNSFEMSNIIKSQKDDVKICSYENAGHIFFGDGEQKFSGYIIKTGGTKSGNKEANKKSIKEINDFLKMHHK